MSALSDGLDVCWMDHLTVPLSKAVDSIAPFSPRQSHGRFWAGVEFRVSSSCFDGRRTSPQQSQTTLSTLKKYQ